MCWCSKAGWRCWFSLQIRRLRLSSGRPRRPPLSALDWFRQRSFARFSVVLASLTLLVQLFGPAVAVNRNFEKKEKEEDWPTLDSSSSSPLSTSSRHVSPLAKPVTRLMPFLPTLPSHPLQPSDASNDESSWPDVDEKQDRRRLKESAYVTSRVPTNPDSGSESSRDVQSLQSETLTTYVDDERNFGWDQNSATVPDRTYFRLNTPGFESAESLSPPDVATLTDSPSSSTSSLSSSDLQPTIPTTPNDGHTAEDRTISQSSVGYDEAMAKFQTTWTRRSNRPPSNTRDVQATGDTWSSDRRNDVVSIFSDSTQPPTTFDARKSQSLSENNETENVNVSSNASSADRTQSDKEDISHTNSSPLVTESTSRTQKPFGFVVRPRRRLMKNSKTSDVNFQTERTSFSWNISELQSNYTALRLTNGTNGTMHNEGIFSNTTIGLKGNWTSDDCAHQLALNQTPSTATESLLDLLRPRGPSVPVSSKCLPQSSQSKVDDLLYYGGDGVNDNKNSSTSIVQEKPSSSSSSSSSSSLSSSSSSSISSNRTLAFCDRVSYCWRTEDGDPEDNGGCIGGNEETAQILDDQVQKMFQRFLDVLLISFDCEDPYSSIWSCHSCQVNNDFAPM